MKWLATMFLLVAVAFALRPMASEAAPNQVLLTRTCTADAGGRLVVTLTWDNNPEGGEQWVEVGTPQQWSDGQIAAYGPLQADVETLAWAGLPENALLAVRVAQLSPEGAWETSPIGYFETGSCRPGELQPALCPIAPFQGGVSPFFFPGGLFGPGPFNPALVPGFFGPGVLTPGYFGPGLVSPGFFGPGLIGPNYIPGFVQPGYVGPALLAPGFYGAGLYAPLFLPPAIFGPGVLLPGFFGPGFTGPGFGHLPSHACGVAPPEPAPCTASVCTFSIVQPAVTYAPAAAPAAQTPTCRSIAPLNPFGYDFCVGSLITSPPANFCAYFGCIEGFGEGRGYVIQCGDLLFAKTGGIQGSCADHGGNLRELYAH